MKPLPQAQQSPKPAPAPQAAPATAAAPVDSKHDLVAVAPTPELNPRNRAAAEIAARSNADSDAAARETAPTGDGETEPVEVAPLAAPPAAEPPADETVPDAPAAAPAVVAPVQAPAEALPGISAETEYDFVIDGVPTKIKGSQVIARVQKGEAADYRLNLASRLLEEAKRTVAPQQQLPAEGVAQQQPASQPVALDHAQLAHLIQFGTPEQAAEALKQINAQRPDVVTQEGLQKVLAQIPRVLDSQLAFRDGLNLAKTQYGDLLDDPDLRTLFFHKENEARKAGDKRTHVELYKEIGDGLRKRFNRPAPTDAATTTAPTATPAAPTIAQKQAAKVAAPAAPKLASVRLEGGAEKPPATREQILEGMRKGRGQQSLITR
jgi:hypothetical protein